MADIENIGDFFQMLLMGPGSYFRLRAQEREEDEAETARKDAEKQAQMREDKLAEMIVGMVSPEEEIIGYDIPELGIGVQPGSPYLEKEGITPEPRTRTVGQPMTSQFGGLVGSLEEGEIDVGDFIYLSNMFSGMGGEMYEPELLEEPEDEIDFDILRTVDALMSQGYMPDYMRELGLVDETAQAEIDLRMREPDLVSAMFADEPADPEVRSLAGGLIQYPADDPSQWSWMIEPEGETPNLQWKDGLWVDPSTGATYETKYYQPDAGDVGRYGNIGGISLIYEDDRGVQGQVDIQMNNDLFSAFYGISDTLKQAGIAGIQHAGATADREARTIGGEPLGYTSTHAQGLALDIKGFYDDAGQYHPISNVNDPLVQSARQIMSQFPDFVDEGAVWHTGIGQAGTRPQVTTEDVDGQSWTDLSLDDRTRAWQAVGGTISQPIVTDEGYVRDPGGRWEPAQGDTFSQTQNRALDWLGQEGEAVAAPELTEAEQMNRYQDILDTISTDLAGAGHPNPANPEYEEMVAILTAMVSGGLITDDEMQGLLKWYHGDTGNPGSHYD